MRHLITVLLFVWTIHAQAQIIIQYHPPISGKVTRIIDGDTYEVAYNFRTTHWRIQGVDTPEKDQPFGYIALDSISKILIGKKVDGFCVKKDLYQRSIVKITKINCQPYDLDTLIIANGWGWSRIGWHGTTPNRWR
jgi:micrococcal nuclease